MNKIKTVVEVLLLAVVAGFVCAMALIISVDLFWSANAKSADTFQSAFWGAFLAFIFVRTGEALNRLYQAGRDSRRALGTIQFTLNEAMSIASDNRYKLDDWGRFVQAARRAGERGSVPIFGNRLVPIPGVRTVLVDVRSIGLVNELFLLDSTIRKLNDSMETWQQAYQDIKVAFITKNVDVATYLANVEQANTKVVELRKFLDALIEEVMAALAATRLAMVPKPLLAKIHSWINPDQHELPNHPTRQEELAKLRAEAKQIGEESRKRIDAVTGSNQMTGKSAEQDK